MTDAVLYPWIGQHRWSSLFIFFFRSQQEWGGDDDDDFPSKETFLNKIMSELLQFTFLDRCYLLDSENGYYSYKWNMDMNVKKGNKELEDKFCWVLFSLSEMTKQWSFCCYFLLFFNKYKFGIENVLYRCNEINELKHLKYHLNFVRKYMEILLVNRTVLFHKTILNFEPFAKAYKYDLAH